MASDRKRLDQVSQHIRRIKISDYAVIVGSSDQASGGYQDMLREAASRSDDSKKPDRDMDR